MIDTLSVYVRSLPRALVDFTGSRIDWEWGFVSDYNIDLPKISGIYFVIHNEEVLYVGKAKNLRKRWNGSWWQHNTLARMWWLSKNTGIHCYIYWLELPFDQVAQAEREFTVLLEPVWNCTNHRRWSRILDKLWCHIIWTWEPFRKLARGNARKVDELHEKQGHTETLPDDDDELDQSVDPEKWVRMCRET